MVVANAGDSQAQDIGGKVSRDEAAWTCGCAGHLGSTRSLATAKCNLAALRTLRGSGIPAYTVSL